MELWTLINQSFSGRRRSSIMKNQKQQKEGYKRVSFFHVDIKPGLLVIWHIAMKEFVKTVGEINKTKPSDYSFFIENETKEGIIQCITNKGIVEMDIPKESFKVINQN